MVTIKEAKTKKDLKKFIWFQNKLYKGNPYYVAPLAADEMGMLTPENNGAFEWCEARYFLAYQDDKIVGRIGTILNHKYNEKVQKKQLRITRFDFIDDREVSKALVDAAIAYAKEKGMTELVGPIGFSDLDKEGMLIEGFDELSMYITIYNFPYYVDHMVALGFEKECDWVEYRIEIPEKVDERIEAICQRSMDKFGYRLVRFKTKKELYAVIDVGLQIMNEVYSHLYGYTALSERQRREFIKNFGIILNTEYLYGIYKDEDLIGYGFLAPSVSKALQKCGGKITIPGLFALLKAMKKNDTVDLYSIGVLPQYKAKGVNAIILNEGIKTCIKNGVKYAETGPELETNVQVQSQWKTFKHRQHKRRRCWKLELH